MSSVKLLFFPGCPHVDGARSALREAFRQLKRQPQWEEIDITASDGGSLAGFGSPTILVNGRDVEPTHRQEGVHCRIYESGMGAPSPDAIIAALLGQ